MSIEIQDIDTWMLRSDAINTVACCLNLPAVTFHERIKVSEILARAMGFDSFNELALRHREEVGHGNYTLHNKLETIGAGPHRVALCKALLIRGGWI